MSTRYQREIEEILEQSSNHVNGQLEADSDSLGLEADSDSLGNDSFAPQSRLPVSIRSFFLSLKPGRLMLASVGLLLTALLLGGFNFSFAGLVAGSGASLFIVGYVLFFIQPSSSKQKRRWRGRPLDYK